MKSKKITRRVFSVMLIILSIVFVIPFLIVLSASFTPEMTLKQFGYSVIPQKLSLEAYEYIFKNSLTQIISSYGVTIFVSTVGTICGVIIMSMIAYPISRPDFKYRKPISFFLYFTMLFSGGMVPSYILISKYLHLTDTIWVLILPQMLGAWNIFLLRTYFASVPTEILESAKIDGLNERGIFIKMIVPLSKHGIATISLFMLLMYWNEWFSSMLYINNDQYVSLQYLLVKILNSVEFLKNNAAGMVNEEVLPGKNLRMATCILAAGPMIAVFPFFQKYFVKGVMVGSVKG